MLKLPGLKSLVIVRTFEKLTCFDHLRPVLWWTLGLGPNVFCHSCFWSVSAIPCLFNLIYLLICPWSPIIILSPMNGVIISHPNISSWGFNNAHSLDDGEIPMNLHTSPFRSSSIARQGRKLTLIPEVQSRGRWQGCIEDVILMDFF